MSRKEKCRFVVWETSNLGADEGCDTATQYSAFRKLLIEGTAYNLHNHGLDNNKKYSSNSPQSAR